MIGDALQRAQYAALMGSPAVSGGRVYDQVPDDFALPYLTIGDEQVIDDSTSCGTAWEVYADVHVWSDPQTGSKAEVKELSKAVIARLATEIPVDGFRTVEGKLETMRTFRESDGETEHSVLTFRYLLDPL